MKSTAHISNLWTANAVEKAMAGAVNGDWAASGVSIDSRTVREGDLFIAIRGPNRDGHEYVGEALAKGAAGAVLLSCLALENAAQAVV